VISSKQPLRSFMCLLWEGQTPDIQVTVFG
jgi:hypothetical protein